MTTMHDIRYLRNLGCCPRCVLLYCGVHEPCHFTTPEAISAATTALIPVALDSSEEHKKLQNDDRDCLCTHTDAVNSIVTSGNNHSSHLDILEDSRKYIPISDLSTFEDVICVSCLGLLQDIGCSQKAIEKVLDIPTLRGYDAPVFSFNISLPVCLAVRTSSIAAHYSCHVENVDGKMPVLVPALKDAWKAAVCPVASYLVGRPCNSGEAPLSVTVVAQYCQDDQECAALWAAMGRSVPAAPRSRGRRPAPYSYHNNGSVSCSCSPTPKYSRQAVQGLLDTLQPAELAARLPLPSPASAPLSLHSGPTARGLVYLAGRYRKLSRQLSQTPWVLNGSLKCRSSVEETIAEPLLQLLGATGLKFLSAGREDVDVRCLGRGRPFALEVTDAHVVELSDEVLYHASQRIAAAGDVHVTHLQLVDRESTAPLRHNLESTGKTYCALCVVRGCTLTEEMLDRLHCAAPLTIHQQTPLRVLHRRPLLTRPRTVHSMSAQRLGDSFFKVTIRTQAGTYIKEFVHGDFGRTRPSLTTLLGCSVDILALDVLDVELDWPATVAGN